MIKPILCAALASALVISTIPAHAQGWAQALTALGAFSQGVQNGEAQRYNMQRGYPAQIQPPAYGAQPQSFIINGRVVTCFPLGTTTWCQ
jgi:hypothetical protein